MTNEKNGQAIKMWKSMDRDLSLRYQLGRLTKDDLKGLVKCYEIKGVSKLKKDELIETIVLNIIEKVSSIVENTNDEIKELITNVIASEGIMEHNKDISIDNITELRDMGILFTGVIDSNEVLVITDEVKNIVKNLSCNCNDSNNKSVEVTKEENVDEIESNVDEKLVTIANQINEMQKIENMRMVMNFLSQKDKEKEVHKKVGRNDLCPCGSGKKYKKCCLGK